MNKYNLKCPRCHSKNYISFDLTSRLIKNINARNVVDNLLLTLSVAVINLDILDVLNVIELHIIHHKYKHYNQYRCGNKKYNHAFSQYHNLNINLTSSKNLAGSLSMKGMRFPLHTIITALTLYFLNNTSTKAIAQFLKIPSNISVSHITIYNWVHKFAPYFKEKAKIFNSQLYLNSDD